MNDRNRIDRMLRELAQRMETETTLSRADVRAALKLDAVRENPDTRRADDRDGTGTSLPRGGNPATKLMF